jgi:D-alanyl-D-alanine carboxypeptidase
MPLQERAVQPWKDMKDAAKTEGQLLTLTAAYRSADEQKSIFMERLSANRISIEGIARGTYDNQVNQLLRTTAVPGYSRHHTGYTIDIGCQNDPDVVFEASLCFKWLSADNYKNTKRFGWIPCYPEGAGEQGPDPESWEYAWVGTDALTE